MSRTGAIVMASLALAACSVPAHAARWATVDAENLELRKGPGDQYDVIAHLKKGSHLHASNYPTQGYFKVRTPGGQIGWVSATSLVLGPLPKQESGHDEPAPADQGGDGEPPPPTTDAN